MGDKYEKALKASQKKKEAEYPPSDDENDGNAEAAAGSQAEKPKRVVGKRGSGAGGAGGARKKSKPLPPGAYKFSQLLKDAEKLTDRAAKWTKECEGRGAHEVVSRSVLKMFMRHEEELRNSYPEMSKHARPRVSSVEDVLAN
jgi:hypothetical protein